MADDIKLDVHHPNIEGVSVFAKNPDIMTPIGIAVAPDGRVFVRESHTHKRSTDYRGPKTDRILVFEDRDGDGVADKRSVYYDGHVHGTDLLFGPDGHLYVSTRSSICRFLKAATQAVADGDPQVIMTCDTTATYPHNGIGGLAIDPAQPDLLAFGFGENLGADYTFSGTDGVRLSGGGEGGTTYVCKTDGSGLRRQSTGHWNAFGMAYDLKGNLFSTDNDPSSTPPNRLLHIIPGADFGFEYRYGRSGRHPLVSWYGDIPGSLGMAGALGEAACGVVPYGPDDLLTASWTDNRIDLHPLQRRGESFTAERQAFISGPDNFRPVHFSYSADGKYLYFTDWVNLSYPVHGSGRIWRITFKNAVTLKPLSGREQQVLTVTEAFTSLGHDDPYRRTRAIQTLVDHPKALKSYDWQDDKNAVRVAHFAVAMKRQDAVGNAAIIPALLEHQDEDVRFVAIKWIADKKLTRFKTDLQRQLDRRDLTKRSLQAIVAALAHMEKKTTGEFSANSTMLKIALDATKAHPIRALALQCIDSDFSSLTVSVLRKLCRSDSIAISREAVRSLVLSNDKGKGAILSEMAENRDLPLDVRADAIAGLADSSADYSEQLRKLQRSEERVVADEAERSLGVAGLAKRDLGVKPAPTDLSAWERLLDDAPGEASTQQGRRLFFHPRIAMCSRCHVMNGRGMTVGPDLTTVHQQSGMNRTWLLEHIINPNAEVAPYFRPQLITTKGGETFMGLIVGKAGKKQGYVSPTGEIRYVLKSDIVKRSELDISVMPPGLLYTMTAAEIRDLLAFLLKGKE